MSHVEARYPAILFKQQLTACVEKIFGLLRDNLKKELSPLLQLCIQVNFVLLVDTLEMLFVDKLPCQLFKHCDSVLGSIVIHYFQNQPELL